MSDDDEILHIVCIPASDPSPWKKTNLTGKCHYCGLEVQHRPHVPTPNRLICIDCFKERQDEVEEISVTTTTLKEWIQKMRH